MTKLFNISTSIILFLPITIFYFLAVVFNNAFQFFGSFHRLNFWYFHLPLTPEQEQMITSSTHEFLIRFLSIIYMFFHNVWIDLKNFTYEF